MKDFHPLFVCVLGSFYCSAVESSFSYEYSRLNKTQHSNKESNKNWRNSLTDGERSFKIKENDSP